MRRCLDQKQLILNNLSQSMLTCLVGVTGVEQIRALVVKARIGGQNVESFDECMHDERNITIPEFNAKRCIIEN